MKYNGRRRLAIMVMLLSFVVMVPLPILLAFAMLDIVLEKWGLISTLAVVIGVIVVLVDFKNIADSRRIALISALGATTAALRLPLTIVPNVQPCTFLIMCSGITLGPTSGFLVGALTPLISNLFLGHGPWTLFQLYSWGIVGFISGLTRFNQETSVWKLSAVGAFFGYLYGLIMNVWFWQSFLYPLTPTTFMLAELQGLYFDTLHALGNMAFLSILGRRTLRLFITIAGCPRVE